MGTNLGNRSNNIHLALRHIQDTIGKISKLSSIYETAAWGKTDQPSFYNQVIIIQTAYSPVQVLNKILEIESMMGRVRSEKWGERLIDIDILFYADQVVNTSDLIIPHPELHYRRFTLAPLVEIAPDLMHPILGQSITELLSSCNDHLVASPLKQIKL